MQDLIASGIGNKIIFTSYIISYFFKMISLLTRKSYDIIHAHWWIPSGFLAAIASIIFRVPLIITVHGTDVRLLKQSLLLRKLARITFRRAAKIVCVSQNVKDNLLSIITGVEDKIAVIPMPADENIFRPLPSKKDEIHTILCIARFTKQKNIETLLEGCAELEEHISSWRLILIGEGPLEDHLKEIARELKIHSKTEFAHFVKKDDLNNYYNDCDLFILPSVDEGFGLVLVEAQLCKKPVIGADSGGIRDIITDGVTGLLFTSGSKTDLCEKILISLHNKEFSHRLAVQGYESAINSFSSRSISRKYQSVFNTLK
jgi:glycosyltransferase involved in cell wall biosynthesis